MPVFTTEHEWWNEKTPLFSAPLSAGGYKGEGPCFVFGGPKETEKDTVFLNYENPDTPYREDFLIGIVESVNVVISRKNHRAGSMYATVVRIKNTKEVSVDCRGIGGDEVLGVAYAHTKQ